MMPTIALIGRPNVGKSTLFNRLTGGHRSLTHDRAGVTRDRLSAVVRRADPHFRLVDTGGLTLDEAGGPGQGPRELRGFETEVLDQARKAMEESQALALVVDGREGLNPLDARLAEFLRRTGKPLILVVNKVDGPEQDALRTAEFHELGLPLVAVSAEHNYNFSELIEELEALAKLAAPEDSGQLADAEPETGLRLALLGRPNAGKSSIVNALLGEDRMIVSEIPGTTRDSGDVTVDLPDAQKMVRRYTFVDTAGVRRRSKIVDSLERLSVSQALKTSLKADVTILVLDALEGLSAQDKRLIALLDARKTPFVVAVNKMDLVEEREQKKLRRDYQDNLSFTSHTPLLFVSARTGSGLGKLLPQAIELWEECQIRIPTARLNKAMTEVLTKHQAPIVKGRRAKFYYMTQAETSPPTFIFFVNDPKRVMESYAKYLENSLRKLFDIRHAPIRVKFRGSHGEE